MTQVSRPMLIALVGTVLFAAVWFTMLRPKSQSVDSTSAPTAQTPSSSGTESSSAADASASSSSTGGTALTDRPAAAQAAANAANGKIAADSAQSNAVANGDGAAASGSSTSASPAATATQSGTSGATTSTSSGATAATAPKKDVVVTGAPAGERAVLQALADDKVVVMLFWERNGADDREARRAVREATSGRSRVMVRYVPVSKVGSYESITGGVTINQSPTTMIIGPSRRAITISGLVDELEIAQAITTLRKG